MLRDPKTLTAEASVGEVRELLANPKVQMVLLVDGPAFMGAVRQLPDGASPRAGTDAEVISPDASDDEAFERTAASPNRRVIVLDENGGLLGLLCLNQSRTGFCRS